MENQDHNMSADLSYQMLGSPSQNSSVIYNVPQQTQQPSFYGKIPSFHQNTSMNQPSLNTSQSSQQLLGQQGLNQPNMQNMSQPGMGQQGMGQQGYNNYSFPMQNYNMMSNQPGNNMQPNFEWFQKAMMGYNQQMMPPMNPGINPMEFFAMANNMMLNNMYRNTMGQNMNPMAQMPIQPPSNIAPAFSPGLPQKGLETPKSYSGDVKIDDVMSTNMNNLNQFYNYLSNQNKDLLNTSYASLSNVPTSSRRSTEYPADINTYLPTQESIMQPSTTNKNYQSQSQFREAPTTKVPPQSNVDTYTNVESTVLDQDIMRRSSRTSHDNAYDSNLSQNRPSRDLERKYNEDFEEGRASNRERSESLVDEVQKPKRGNFEWEDVPLVSKFISKKQEEREAESGRDDSHYQRPKRSFDMQEYKNPHDDIPVAGKTYKRFEDLLEEQLKANPNAVVADMDAGEKNPNKHFLKKGTRNFLANAREAKTPGSKVSQKENISANTDFPHENDVMVFNTTDYSSLKANNNFMNRQEKFMKDTSKHESNQLASKPEDKPREPRKYLAKGAGRGGGVGADKTRKSANRIEDHEEDRSKSVNTRKKLEHKRTVGDDHNDRPIKTDKSYDRARGGFERARSNASYSNDDNEGHSFDREYNFEKYTHKSPRGQNGNRSNNKGRRSPRVEDEHEYREGHEEDINEHEDEDVSVSNVLEMTASKLNNIRERSNEEGEEYHGEGGKREVDEKLEMLNSEIAKFKLENERVKKIRQKHEEMLKNLNKDVAEWNKQKEKNMKEMEQWKQDELRKMKNEKKLAERNQKTAATTTNKKDKEEIENLKKQIAKITEDFQIKEKRSKLNMERLKKQVEELTQRNNELVQELKQSRTKGPLPKGQPVSNEESRAGANRRRDEQQQQHRAYGDEPEEEEDEEIVDENDQDYDEEKNVIEETNEDEEHEGSEGEENYNEEEHDEQDNQRFVQGNRHGGHGNVDHQRTSSIRSSMAEQNVIKHHYKFTDQDYRFDSNPFFKKYVLNRSDSGKVISQTSSGDGKIQKVYADGKKEVLFHNGVRREIFPDNYTIVHFANKDIKQTLPDSTVIYFFADAQTTQTTLPNGLHVYRFANNQIEFHNPDGSKNIYFADQTMKVIFQNGEEETVFGDGTVQRVNAQKVKMINYASGQKDVIYPDGLKVRKYPDGRTKKYYPDGTVEEL